MKKIKIWKKEVSPLTITLLGALLGGVLGIVGSLINVLLPRFIDGKFESNSNSSYSNDSKPSDSPGEAISDSPSSVSESNSKTIIAPYKSSVISLEDLPIDKEAYTLSDIDFTFFNKHDGTDALKILVSGDIKKVNGYKIVVAKVYENGFIKRGYETVEYGSISPDSFDIIAVLYDWDGKYVTLSKASVYTDQDRFSHIEIIFDNVDYGTYYVDFF